MKLTEKFNNDLFSLLGKKFTDDEYQRGFKAFEKLLNIENDNSNFDKDYADFLNKSDIISPRWDVKSGCRLEGFLWKIESLKGKDVDKNMLGKLYGSIGFYDWLNDTDIKKARASDLVNSANADNTGNEGFHLDKADASKYVECGHYFSNYIMAYQMRNDQAHDNPSDGDYSSKIKSIESLFVVYIDQCIKNYDLICDIANDEILNKKIDYIRYAKEKLADYESFNKSFLQITWYDENNAQFTYEYDKCIKFIGEAGMGKTTQMRKMYFDALEHISNGQLKLLPVWLDLSDMSELKDDNPLGDKISELLGDYKEFYDLILEKNIIMLFLDGYNEVLTKDDVDSVKRKLGIEIDNIHAKFPDVFIAMTDRKRKTKAPCLKNVSVYTYNGLNRDEIKKYVQLKEDEKNTERVLDYLNSEASAWIGNTNIIPEKINALIEFLNSGIIPIDEDEFYDKYLDYLFEREEYAKKETRIDDLKYLLYILAQQLSGPLDEKPRQEIIRLWLNEGQVGHLHPTENLFALAVELHVLVPGINDNSFKFAYPQYYYKMEAGL